VAIARGGIPAGTGFATKPELALRMITCALDGGTPAAWVTGNEVYGADPGLRAGLEQRRMSYVLAVAKSHLVTTAAGAVRAEMLAGRLPPRAWQRLSAGPGAKGHRWYDWEWVAIDPGMPGHRHLLAMTHDHHDLPGIQVIATGGDALSRWRPAMVSHQTGRDGYARDR
jgi:SRSO17 transposase